MDDIEHAVFEAIKRLSAEEQQVVQHRVLSEKPMTLKELGDRLGVSRETARLLEIQTTMRLREELTGLDIIDLMSDKRPGNA